MKREILTTILMLFVIPTISASCVVPYDGMNINQSITFCQGKYYLGNGIIINPIFSNIILDCNNSKLIGNETLYYNNAGFLINSFANYNVTIKNCIAENYTNGFFVENNLKGGTINFFNNTAINNILFGFRLWDNKNNLIENTAIKNGFHGFDIMSKYNYLENNVALDNYRGFELSSTSKNIATDNILIGNFIKGNSNCGIELNIGTTNNTITKNTIIGAITPVYLAAMYINGENNKIWDNYIYFGGIFGGESSNLFCVNCIGNHYFNESLGPTCPISCNCKDSDKDGVCNNKDLCPKTPQGVEVDQDGCSNIQFCLKQPICGLGCDLADWKNNEPGIPPHDCITVIVSKEGDYYPKCAAYVGATCGG